MPFPRSASTSDDETLMSTNGDKPKGEGAGWKLRGSKTRFENEIFRVREDDVELKGGKQVPYAYCERGDAVVIVPITRNGEMVLLKQYRYAIDEWCLETPAGGMHDTGDASPEEVAGKELREEVGATFEKLTYIDSFFSAPALSDEHCHVFLAEGVELSKKPQTEASETLETQLVPVTEALELARRGKMKSAPCALAVLLCESHLQRRSTRGQRTPNESLET
ncbi:MAG: NUDIX hydrolase [Verrucomicrobiota bacterium]|nr:NUDIX hydrolase [Verrucomicrobiota bacterium]